MTKQSDERIQTSESLAVGSILAIIGGYMDSYSYICRGGVFANAATGNVVHLAISFASFKWIQVIKYMIPITAFATGVIISSFVKLKRDNINAFHWRQVTVFIEIIVLAVVAFIPQEMNLLANSIISLTCGIQATAFNKFHDNAMSTTMCTGNLRNGMQCLCSYGATKNKEYLRRALIYIGCIFLFILGAMIGSKVSSVLLEKSILIPAFCLFAVLILMFTEKRKK